MFDIEVSNVLSKAEAKAINEKNLKIEWIEAKSQ
jgi:hypothetical protein